MRTSNLTKYFSTFYRTLGVQQTATAQQIKRSFLNLAKKHHPDGKEIPDDHFIKIKTAYDTLKDPDLRKAYDYELIHGKYSERPRTTYYYSETSSQPRHARLNLRSIFSTFGMAVIFSYFFSKMMMKDMTEHEIRRQNVILSRENIDSTTGVQQKRRKMFMQEMKDKKISTKVVTIKTSTSAKETTKAKNSRKNTLQSISGIKKTSQPVKPANMDQYM